MSQASVEPDCPPLLAAACASRVGGVWRVSLASLAAAEAAAPSLGERRCLLGRFSTVTGTLTVLWASAASFAAWERPDLGGIGVRLSHIARSNIAIGSIFSAASQAASRGDRFVQVVAVQGAKVLHRMRFTPVDVVPDEADAALAAVAAGFGGDREPLRCVLEELLLPEEASPEHEQLVQRARACPLPARRRRLAACVWHRAACLALSRLPRAPPAARPVFAERYSSSLLTVVALSSGRVLHQNLAALRWHGCVRAGGGADWLRDALLGGDAARLAAALADVAAGREVRLRAAVAPSHGSAHALAAASSDAATRWHEVVLTYGVDPVTLEPVAVVTESDISGLKAAEAELERLHAAQLDDYARSEAALEALLCSCFPAHVAHELLDNLMSAKEAADAAAAAAAEVAEEEDRQARDGSDAPSVPPSPAPSPGPQRLGVMARRRSGTLREDASSSSAGSALSPAPSVSSVPERPNTSGGETSGSGGGGELHGVAPSQRRATPRVSAPAMLCVPFMMRRARASSSAAADAAEALAAAPASASAEDARESEAAAAAAAPPPTPRGAAPARAQSSLPFVGRYPSLDAHGDAHAQQGAPVRRAAPIRSRSSLPFVGRSPSLSFGDDDASTSAQRGASLGSPRKNASALVRRLHADGALGRVAARRHSCVTIVFSDSASHSHPLAPRCACRAKSLTSPARAFRHHPHS
jgi:hypothetical protein